MSLTILLVDDDRQVRNSGKQTLELAGYTVVCCDNGEQALRQVTRDCGALITDVRMPGMDGFGLMERTLAIDPDLPVIMITGHGDVSTAAVRPMTAVSLALASSSLSRRFSITRRRRSRARLRVSTKISAG